MKIKEQLDQILFPTTKIGGSVKHLIGIANLFRTNTKKWMDPTIQTKNFHLNQETVMGHSDQKHPPLSSLDSGTDVTRSTRNIDNLTDMIPQGPIATNVPDYNRANNYNIFELVRRKLNPYCRGSPCKGTTKSENLAETIRGNKI